MSPDNEAFELRNCYPQVSPTAEQHGNLHNWDVFIEEISVQLQAEKPHIVTEHDRRQFDTHGIKP